PDADAGRPACCDGVRDLGQWPRAGRCARKFRAARTGWPLRLGDDERLRPWKKRTGGRTDVLLAEGSECAHCMDIRRESRDLQPLEASTPAFVQRPDLVLQFVERGAAAVVDDIVRGSVSFLSCGLC